MATREQLHRDVDALPEPDVAKARIVVDEYNDSEPTLVPERLRRFDSGRRQPDWAEAIRRSRAEH